MARRNPLITEFTVQVFADGRIDWGGAGEFLWWILHSKRPGGFGADVRKIARFGMSRVAPKRPKQINKIRRK